MYAYTYTSLSWDVITISKLTILKLISSLVDVQIHYNLFYKFYLDVATSHSKHNNVLIGAKK